MSKKTLYAFIASFVLLITVIILNYLSFTKTNNYAKSVDHTRMVITTFESLSKNFKSAQIYTTTYKTDSLKKFYTLYKKDADSVAQELNDLKLLVSDNPNQVKLVDTLNGMINRQLPILMKKNIAEIIAAGEGWRLDTLFAIHELINTGINNEKELLKQRKSDLDNSTYWDNILSIAFGIIAIGIFFFTFFNNLFIARKRKWLEGFLESIFNTSKNGIVYYKAIREHGKITDFKIDYINDATGDLLQLSPQSVINKKLSEFPSYVKETGLLKKYTEVVETGIPLEFETLYKRGAVERWLWVSLSKLEDGVTASFHDISQLKNYEAELKEKIKDLEHSNAELEQYAYIASHDLQEPLRKIRSFGSYLQDTQAVKLDEKGREQLGKILNAAERMSSLIKDILGFSSLKKQSEFVNVDLNETLQNVLRDLDLLITQKNATIQSDALPTIEAIPLQMTQLFYNLINNSLKFSKENIPPSIFISCKQVADKTKPSSLFQNKIYYEIIVSDNGIGFEKDYSEQIFGLFKRLNDRRFYPGSGIGLALCKKVVENHHGMIDAEGKENEGAIFHIFLPEKQD